MHPLTITYQWVILAELLCDGLELVFELRAPNAFLAQLVARGAQLRAQLLHEAAETNDLQQRRQYRSFSNKGKSDCGEKEKPCPYLL